MTGHSHHHHEEITEESVKLLIVSFVINMILTVAEIVGGIISAALP